jgi:hypothetical protein
VRFSSYDDFRLNGRTHRCECSDVWTDSDFGPCHERCTECNELCDVNELNDGICEECKGENVN